MQINKRPLGSSGLEITTVGFGAWAIGGGGWSYGWGPQDDEASIATMRRAIELGINWIDTAAVYGLGHSEQVVGHFLHSLRASERPFVFTKCGMIWDERNPMEEPKRVLRPESIRAECDASLRRLGIERIDLYQFHRPDPNVPFEESMGTLADLQKAPIAIEALQRIAALYAIEARVRGKTAAERQAVRQVESKPLVDALRVWFEAQIAKLPARGPMAEAIRYALNHWDGLRRFLEDGRIEIDSNSIERAMRPVSLSRKNSLFAGSDQGGENWACLASLIETCLCRARHSAVYAARRTMPKGSGMTHDCRSAVGCCVAVSSVPFGIV